MINEIVIPHRKARYRIFEVEGSYYMLDLDRPLLSILFPFIIWFIPHRIYQINEEIYEELREVDKEKTKKPTDKKTKVFLSIILPIGFIGAFLGRLLAPVADVFDDLFPFMFSFILMFFVLIGILGLRIYLSRKIYKKVDKMVGGLVELPESKIKIRPKKIKDYFVALFYYIFFGGLIYLSINMTILYNNLSLLFVLIVTEIIFLLLSMVFFIPSGYAKVKFIKSSCSEDRYIT